MDQWKKDHDALYGDHVPKPARPQKLLANPQEHLRPARVSLEAHAYILDLEAACFQMVFATSDTEVKEAYANLSNRRRDLYKHIQRAENGLHDRSLPTATLRF